jgi:hypothetical protein
MDAITLNDMPGDVIINIGKKLPICKLLRATCKSWQEYIDLILVRLWGGYKLEELILQRKYIVATIILSQNNRSERERREACGRLITSGKPRALESIMRSLHDRRDVYENIFTYVLNYDSPALCPMIHVALRYAPACCDSNAATVNSSYIIHHGRARPLRNKPADLTLGFAEECNGVLVCKPRAFIQMLMTDLTISNHYDHLSTGNIMQHILRNMLRTHIYDISLRITGTYGSKFCTITRTEGAGYVLILPAYADQEFGLSSYRISYIGICDCCESDDIEEFMVAVTLHHHVKCIYEDYRLPVISYHHVWSISSHNDDDVGGDLIMFFCT